MLLGTGVRETGGLEASKLTLPGAPQKIPSLCVFERLSWARRFSSFAGFSDSPRKKPILGALVFAASLFHFT